MPIMTNEKALILAFMMAGLAAASYHYGYRGIAIVALFAVAAFAIWPIRLKWGFAGREQWQEIRLRGRTYFVLTRGVWFAGVLVSWTLATQYVADSHLPNRWFRELLCYLGLGCIYGLILWRSRERKHSQQEGIFSDAR